jgi:hypothetical protein
MLPDDSVNTWRETQDQNEYQIKKLSRSEKENIVNLPALVGEMILEHCGPLNTKSMPNKTSS